MSDAPAPATAPPSITSSENQIAGLLLSKEFEQIRAIQQEFNPFEVLAVSDAEIRHSNVLAWLLDPRGSHGLRDHALRRLVIDMVQFNEQIAGGFPVLEFLRHPLTDVVILREFEDIDLLIRSPSLGVTIAIENKVHSGESDGQLTRYRKVCEARFPNDTRAYVFLTLTGSNPNGDESYGVYSHQRIHRVLTETMDLFGQDLNAKTRDFIRFYLRTLEMLTMDDDRLKNLCRDVYRDHKATLDLILRYGKMAEYAWEPALDHFLEQVSGIEVLYRSDSQFWFLPQGGSALQRPIADPTWLAKRLPISLWFNWPSSMEKLGIVIEVGPCPMPEQRIRLMKHLKANGFKFQAYGMTEPARYTRIVSQYRKFSEWDSREALGGMMVELYQSIAADRDRLLKALATYDWS